MISPIVSIFRGNQVGKATVDLLFSFIFTLQISCEFLSLINSKPKPCREGYSGKHNSVLEEMIVALAPCLFNVVKYKRKMTKETGYELLLLMLSRFSHVRLCATPQTTAHQAPRSLGFSRQEHWSELPFPSPMHVCMLSRFSHVRLCDPMDSSPPGSSVHRILQQEYWMGCHFLLQDIN